MACSATRTSRIWDHEGKSNYNSLQTQFINRFGRGSQVQASYTLSRSRANIALTSSRWRPGQQHDATRQHQSGSSTGAGRRPAACTSSTRRAIWMLSPLEGQSRAMRAAFGDWEVDSDRRCRHRTAADGLHRVRFRASTADRRAPATTTTSGPTASRASRVAPTSGPTEQIINPNAYTLNGFQLGTIGNAGARRLHRARLLPDRPGVLQELPAGRTA